MLRHHCIEVPNSATAGPGEHVPRPHAPAAPFPSSLPPPAAWLRLDPDAAVARLEGLRATDERTEHLYRKAIHVLGVHGRFDEAVGLVPRLTEMGIRPSIEVYNSLINACSRQRNLEAAMSVLDSMRESGVEPDGVTYGSLMHAAGRARQPDEALKLLAQAKEEGVMPTASMYNTALHGLI